MTELSKQPVADRAEHNAFFPSEYSLTQYTAKKTDFDGFKFDKPYTGGKYKVLMIGTDERYIPTKAGNLFSTGNHPVEMLLPMLHMHQAGFEIDVATLSGNPVKLEIWAMPEEDEAVMNLYQQYLPKLVIPKKLGDILAEVTAEDSPYIAVFIPGGHGVLAGIPHSHEVKAVLDWALANDKYIITLCHGPASLLAAGVGEAVENFPFKGYEICVFPDALDEGANQAIGYMPGKLEWLVAENLQKLGVKVLNEGITGQVHKDRKLLTGDSPLASNALGILAADELLKTVA
ncbi:glyoxalase III HchA [Suttonella ornithocola]|uniref:Molecular chaperone Hsp31 and glyoxalase 3 n=1 Tax=Suttonella ornithocola TaxID=279832 RepID=A0A380MQH2_9GAMM|nr:glyoxalase III HchA [Suttonella ornithocola]SUO93961.1 Molecular chaperone Hsp31 and glyoxalase 3 [Suttonella ornithocola]